MQINDVVSVPTQSIPIDEPLTFSVYVPVAEKLVLFRVAGDKITRRRRNDLQTKKVDLVYVLQSEFSRYMENLRKQKEEPDSPESEARNIRNLLFGFGRSFEIEDQLRKATFVEVKNLVSGLVKLIYSTPALGLTLIERYKDAFAYYVNHSINVAVYAALVGRKRGLSTKDMEKMTLAAFFHNIGNLQISPDVLNKQGALTKKEWEMVQQHSVAGARILEEVGASTEIIRVAREHHERVDGQGYPKGLVEDQIHFYSKVCAIADVYDALISNRPHKKAMSPPAALEKMQWMLGHFDPQILVMVTNL